MGNVSDALKIEPYTGRGWTSVKNDRVNPFKVSLNIFNRFANSEKEKGWSAQKLEDLNIFVGYMRI